MIKNIYGKNKYYKTFKDNHFVNTIIGKEKKIKDNYNYIPRSFLIRGWYSFFYYFIAYPILFIMLKCKYGVKVYGRKNLKHVKGAILIGNHSNIMDGCFASVMVSGLKHNYIVCNKDVVQVVIGKYFTKALGALPLPDSNRGLANLSQAVDEITKKGHYVTIFPEACIWPYYTKVRPMPVASFHYAIKSNVPVIPFAVTYRYAKGKRYLSKKPKVNITICEPIYPNLDLNIKERKEDLCLKTTNVLKSVIETDNNINLYNYIQVGEDENIEKFLAE